MSVAGLYTKDYFENHGGSNYGEYIDWPFFKERAEWIVKTYKPKSVLEIGAAKGFMLKHLKDLGVKVSGYDISEYASGESGGLVKSWDVTKGVMDFTQYDLVVSFDFLEHIEDNDLAILLVSLKTARNQFHMITTDEYDFHGDSTHCSMYPKQWWLDKFDDSSIKNYTIIHAGEQEEFMV